MFIVGLTGGIASGKSTAATFFRQLGIEIVDADIIAREVVAIGQPSLEKIATHFGQSILLPNGALNRASLRNIVFSEPDEKHWLEKLLHPLIYAAAQEQLQSARGDYVIYMSPLIFESRQRNWCNRIIVVDIPETMQIQRACLRDHASEEAIRHILNSQMPRNARLAAADEIIDNSGTPDDLQQRINIVHRVLVKIANNYKNESLNND